MQTYTWQVGPILLILSDITIDTFIPNFHFVHHLVLDFQAHANVE